MLLWPQMKDSNSNLIGILRGEKNGGVGWVMEWNILMESSGSINFHGVFLLMPGGWLSVNGLERQTTFPKTKVLHNFFH